MRRIFESCEEYRTRDQATVTKSHNHSTEAAQRCNSDIGSDDSLFYGILVVCLVVIHGSDVRSLESKKSRKKWDSLLFSQQWPVTSCIQHKESHYGASCQIFKNVSSWTVHGLWPTVTGSRFGPSFCNKSWPFVEAKVADIELQLLRYWTNIYKDTGKLSLWQHEWSKHGTCAASLPQLGDEHKYFSKGLEWVLQYDLRTGLAQHGIIPSTNMTYTSEAIFSALTALYNTDPIVDCIYDKETKTQLLAQIKLCFTRDLKLMSCNKHSVHSVSPHGRGNCPSKGIYYLPSVSSLEQLPAPPAPSTPAEALERMKDARHDQETNRKTCNTLLCQAIFTVYALNIVPL
ncbi:Ribonuclease T2-like [Trinorchestia longiramus]|nr:Ribonuclease T2-like [Trinorchestia longiramus]